MKERLDLNNRIIWIILVTIVWYLFILSTLGWIFDSNSILMQAVGSKLTHMRDATLFTCSLYLCTLPAFIGAFVYTRVTRRNQFIFKTFLPSHLGFGKTVKLLLWGLAVGFVMNFGCIVCALLHGDIKLFLNFSLTQIPFYVFAIICVFIQSSSEELWTRGFMYERINVRYPLWVAMLVNGLFFGCLHMFNPGAGFLPILDICICGVAFSLAKWYTGSIWFPAGIHTAWNFTQNYLFGLPNSGLVSEVSIFGLDAANARDTLIYSVPFGVEGAIPAVFADLILGVVCLLLAAKNGRLGELKQIRGESPEFIAYKEEKARAKARKGEPWKYAPQEQPEREEWTAPQEQPEMEGPEESRE